MLSINDLKVGVNIQLDGETYTVVWYQHGKAARGGGFVRTKLKNLKTGAALEQTFKGSTQIEEAEIERKKAQYLYPEKSNSVFMDSNTYEQFSIPTANLGNSVDFLKEGTEVYVIFIQDKPTNVELPVKMEFTITQTDPGVRGNTVSAVTKPAKIETGATIQVPLFINTGDVVRVDTRDGNYVERVNK